MQNIAQNTHIDTFSHTNIPQKKTRNNEPKTAERKTKLITIFIGAKLKLNSNIKIKKRNERTKTRRIKKNLLFSFVGIIITRT